VRNQVVLKKGKQRDEEKQHNIEEKDADENLCEREDINKYYIGI
jgi:hypothetical protein